MRPAKRLALKILDILLEDVDECFFQKVTLYDIRSS